MVKKPKIELFAFKLALADGEITEEQGNTAIPLGAEEELDRQYLSIQTARSNVFSINPDGGSLTICCPKLPKDTDASTVYPNVAKVEDTADLRRQG